MKRTMFKTLIALALVLALSLCFVACKPEEKKPDAPDSTTAQAEPPAKTTAGEEESPADEPAKPGETGFNEYPIGDEVIVGPFQVAMVYFQGVDMIPEGKQPSGAESDMHLEADIALTKEAAQKFGFGESFWPAYLTVDYKVLDKDGKEVTAGSMMPMNADDGPHYGINISKGKIAIGKYKVVLEIQASADYLLHVDSETGVPVARDESKDAAAKYYEKQTAEFEWNYDGKQLPNE